MGVVKYFNDLNNLTLKRLKPLEQNFLIGIFDKIGAEAKEILVLDKAFFKGFCKKHFTNRELDTYIKVFIEKLFRLNLMLDKDNIKGELYLFSCYALKENVEFESLEIGINKDFLALFGDLKRNYTSFKLKDFVQVRTKYAKILYRYLKQFKSTGYVYFEWEDFKTKFNIADTYDNSSITNFILKPMVKELQRFFSNLECKKISQLGRKGNIKGVEFRFDMLDTKSLDSIANAKQNIDSQIQELKQYEGLYYSKNGLWLYVDKILYIDNKVHIKLYDSDTRRNENVLFDLENFNINFAPHCVKA